MAVDCGGGPGDDDSNYARNREDAVAPDDAVHGVSELPGIARTGGMGMPEETGSDVAQEGNHRHDMQELDEEIRVHVLPVNI